MREYKVGDKVTIRSWESMEREFGVSDYGNICLPGFYFIRTMERFCGFKYVIDENLGGSYHIENGLGYAFTPQMFTDWETDNAKEMKMQYNGQEVELITEGYWPEGVTLICSEDGVDWNEHGGIVCISDGMPFYKGGYCGQFLKHWALIPAKPAPRRLTNREVAKLCRAGWNLLDGEWVYAHASYKKEYENDPTPQGVTLRAPNSDEWLEPTSELLEGTK